jgi:hypothetical protein
MWEHCRESDVEIWSRTNFMISCSLVICWRDTDVDFVLKPLFDVHCGPSCSRPRRSGGDQIQRGSTVQEFEQKVARHFDKPNT